MDRWINHRLVGWMEGWMDGWMTDPGASMLTLALSNSRCLFANVSGGRPATPKRALISKVLP